MTHASAADGKLLLRTGTAEITLDLGSEAATRWAKAITDPPSLAKRLGIEPGKQIWVTGELSDPDLIQAISTGTRAIDGKANLAFASSRTGSELKKALELYEAQAPECPHLWVIYRKGANQELSEADVRSTLRQSGLVDTKVARVSDELTALRFSRRKTKA